MLLVDADRVSVHAVLPLEMGQTRLCVLRLVGRVHVLVLEMVLIRMMGAHRVNLRQVAVCGSMRCRMLHGVRSETLQRTWNCSLVVRKSCWVHGAHRLSLIHLSHKVPRSSSHHTRLTHRLGFNFVSKRWRRGGHLVVSGSQRLQFGVLPHVSCLASAVRWTVPGVIHLWCEKLRHETADWARTTCEAHGAVVALCGQVRGIVVAAVWHGATAAALRRLRQGIRALLRGNAPGAAGASNVGADGVRQDELQVQELSQLVVVLGRQSRSLHDAELHFDERVVCAAPCALVHLTQLHRRGNGNNVRRDKASTVSQHLDLNVT